MSSCSVRREDSDAADVTAAYARKSRVSHQGYTSCDAQIAICRDLAESNGFEVAECFSDDGQSSETLDRPALKRLLDAIETGRVNRLFVDRLDRLTRLLTDLLMLLERFDNHHVELVVVNDPNFGDSAASRLMTNIVAAASEFQQDITRERMADMRSALKQRGKRVAGCVPFGYKAEEFTKKLVPDSDEAIVVRDFFKLASDGARPSDLANLANLSGWKDQNGATGKWTARRIIQMLSNETYIGRIHHPEGSLPGEHQAIVDNNIFDAVQQHLASRRTSSAGRTDRTDPDAGHGTYLRGKVVCGTCGRTMSISTSHRGSIRYIYYRCRSSAGGRPPCIGTNIGAHDLEKIVRDLLGDTHDADSEIPIEQRRWWNELPESEQKHLLPNVINEVVYDSKLGEATIDLRDDFANLIGMNNSEDELPV